jgi:uncharacterized protein (TIGR01777 family)
MTIAITGASGFIGTRLANRFRAQGEPVRPVSLRSELGPGAFDGCQAVVHLAGEPVAQRWTAAARKRIVESRVNGTQSIIAALAALKQRPAVLISASGVGYYGDRGDEILKEDSPPGDDFLARVVTAWESEALRAEKLGIRVVCPRMGAVLGHGGVLERLVPLFRLGVGGRIGSGKQWMSWIHVEDLLALIQFAIRNDRLSGPVNAVAPTPVRNAEFTRVLAAVLHRPAMFPVPGIALKAVYGEMSEMLLGGQRVLPEKARREGFEFRYPELHAALADILSAS